MTKNKYHELIKEHTQNILDSTRVKDNEYVFNVSAFAEGNISITAQRRRALNLAWALSTKDIVRHEDVVTVVGAGFAGLAFAVGIALSKRCTVVIIEKDDVFAQFRQSAFRFIDKALNTSASISGVDGFFNDAFPLFRWEGGHAHNVTSDWLSEFRYYQKCLPIFLLEGLTCRSLTREEKGVSLHVKGESIDARFFADRCVLATGFGYESNPLGLSDYAYWRSGASFHYHTNKISESVLVCGGGDSGLIEVLHYLVDGFEHKHLEGLINNVGRLSPSDEMCISSEFNTLTQLFPDEDSDFPLPHHLLKTLLYCLNRRFDKDSIGPLTYRYMHQIYKIVSAEIGNLNNLDSVNPDEIDDYCNQFYNLSGDTLCKLEDLTNQIQNNEMEKFLDSYFPAEVKMATDYINEHTREDFKITWCVSSKGLYSGGFSKINLPLVLALAKSKKLIIEKNRVSTAEKKNRGYEVTFKHGGKKIHRFDRVCSRFGPSKDTLCFKYEALCPDVTIEPNQIMGSSLYNLDPTSDHFKLKVDDLRSSYTMPIAEKKDNKAYINFMAGELRNNLSELNDFKRKGKSRWNWINEYEKTITRRRKQYENF